VSGWTEGLPVASGGSNGLPTLALPGSEATLAWATRGLDGLEGELSFVPSLLVSWGPGSTPGGREMCQGVLRCPTVSGLLHLGRDLEPPAPVSALEFPSHSKGWSVILTTSAIGARLLLVGPIFLPTGSRRRGMGSSDQQTWGPRTLRLSGSTSIGSHPDSQFRAHSGSELPCPESAWRR
jgi:hypothetical protein